MVRALALSMQWMLFWWYPMASRGCSRHQTKAFLFCCLSTSICSNTRWGGVVEHKRIILVIFSDRRGNRHRWKYRNFKFFYFFFFFNWGMFKHWNKLLIEVAEPLCLEIFKIHMDTILDNLPWLTLHWVGRSPEVFPQLFCDSVPTEIPSFLNHPNSSFSILTGQLFSFQAHYAFGVSAFTGWMTFSC